MKAFIPLIAILLAGGPEKGAQEASAPIIDNKDTVYRTWTNNAWSLGEFLSYRVHYGIMNAGEVELVIEKELMPIGDRKVYHIHAKGRSYSGFDWFFRVRDHYQTYIDNKAIQPLQFSKIMEEGKYKDSDFALFNYKTKMVSSAKKGSVAFTGDIQDVISAIYFARTINIKDAQPGDVFPIQIYLDGEVHDLQFKYVKKEVIKTDIGKVNAVKVVPMLVADRVFKEEEGMELWVSDDDNKVPLRVKAGLLVGSVKVDITAYNNLLWPINMAN